MKKLGWGLVFLCVAGCSEDGRPSNDHDDGGTGGAAPIDAQPDAHPDFPAIPLVGSAPSDGARDVPGTTWVRLDFGSALPPTAGRAVRLDCGDGTPEIDVDALGDKTLVVNPRGRLPAGATCTVDLGDAGSVSFASRRRELRRPYLTTATTRRRSTRFRTTTTW
jgi:hypothetical protein